MDVLSSVIFEGDLWNSRKLSQLDAHYTAREKGQLRVGEYLLKNIIHKRSTNEESLLTLDMTESASLLIPTKHNANIFSIQLFYIWLHYKCFIFMCKTIDKKGTIFTKRTKGWFFFKFKVLTDKIQCIYTFILLCHVYAFMKYINEWI